MELNKAQKRAISLHQDLNNLHPDHLHSFINGIEPTEPPNYRLVQGVIQPRLDKVTLKAGAESYEIGNVIYNIGQGVEIRRVTIRVEKGSFKVKKDEKLPEDEGNLLSHPIQRFVAQEAGELWKIKYQAIVDTMDHINAVRTFAYNLPQQPRRRSINGQAPSQTDDLDGESNSAKPLKRKPGEPVAQHACNKRAKVGLDVSPAAKIDAVSNMADQIKIDLFDAIAKASMPNYPVSVDNILMAGWNVVSIFTHVGTESAELTKSIVELKTVLSEFEGKNGKKKKAKKDEGAGAPKPEVAPNPERTPPPSFQDNATPRKPSSPVMARKNTSFDDHHPSQDTHALSRSHQPHSNSNGDYAYESAPTKQLLPHQRRLGGLEALQMYTDLESDRASPEDQRERSLFASPHPHQDRSSVRQSTSPEAQRERGHFASPHQHPDLVGLNVGGGSPHEPPRAHRRGSSLASAVQGSKKNSAGHGDTMMPPMLEAPMGHNVGREREREREREKERGRASSYYH
ncbi:hypothetical protein BDV96DRAFT_165032 [Lophiotrema nucula]|uniref:Uncharacterized protein n=1 Tax=Lophiotrema nucula TaxID=690887 RepID=A0A6A5YXU4_9PLEO|nr:hypothetical protein BDV96DRAFT_165032 [Lophiotrema nucula]